MIRPGDNAFVGFSGKRLLCQAASHHEVVANFKKVVSLAGASHLMKELAIRIHTLTDEVQKLFHSAEVTIVGESRFAGTFPQIVNVNADIPEGGLVGSLTQAQLTNLPENPRIADG